jgi:hypothetical protein
MRRIASALLAVAAGILMSACGSGARLVADRYDPTLPRATIGTPGWEYARVGSGDFDGDGTLERAVLLARVHLRNGQPVWDDWNVWQMYVEEPTGERTYFFSSPIQLGNLEPTISEPDADGRRTVVMVEHTPQSVVMYELDYDGPGSARLMAIAERTVDASQAFVAPGTESSGRR